jgi:hypothetical protein
MEDSMGGKIFTSDLYEKLTGFLGLTKSIACPIARLD